MSLLYFEHPQYRQACCHHRHYHRRHRISQENQELPSASWRLVVNRSRLFPFLPHHYLQQQLLQQLPSPWILVSIFQLFDNFQEM